MPLDVTREEIHQWEARSRAAQGLPPKITDEAVVLRIITLAFAGLPDEQPAAKEADGDGGPTL
jgi:hypothetical protein